MTKTDIPISIRRKSGHSRTPIQIGGCLVVWQSCARRSKRVLPQYICPSDRPRCGFPDASFDGADKCGSPVFQAKALYTYNATNQEEMSFSEGDTLDIIDKSEADWWKTEKEGSILIVPASYLELHG